MSIKYRLDDVCDISMGQAPAGEAYNDVGDGWPLIAGAGDFGDLYPAPKKFTREASRTSKVGDIVVGIRASIGEKVLSDGEYCLGRGVAGLRAGKNLEPRFLWHWLTQITPTLMGKARGATFLQVNKGDIGELEIELPSLEEQRRIAAILDQTETLRAQRRQALTHLDSLTQSLFLDMFGDAVSNPRAWPLSTMGEISEVQGGLQVTTARKDLPLEVPYLRVANVYRGFLELSEIKMIRATAAEVARTTLAKNDLLVVEGHGNPNEIGRAALWTGEVAGCVHQNHLIRARFDLSKVVPVFACEYVNSPGGRRHLLRAGKSTSGLNTISVSNVREAPVALPPLPLQQTFATRIQAIEALKTSQRAALAELDALFASLQQRAFNGELTRPAAAVQAAPTKARNFSDLCQLEAGKGLEALIYVSKRMPQHDLYKSLKALYFADKHHLEHHGALIYGETYCALQHGPVPQAAYDLTKALERDAGSDLFADDPLRATLRLADHQLIPSRDADFAKLGAAERQSLDWAIRYCGSMSFEQTKTASHDTAYRATPSNAPMAMDDIIRMLPQAAQRRFWG